MSDLKPEGPQISYEDVAKMVDGIPDFKWKHEDLYSIEEDPGWFPGLGGWFVPKVGRQDDRNYIDNIMSSKEFQKWRPAKILEGLTLKWREPYHALPYFSDKTAKEMIDKWEEEGDLETKLNRLHTQNISGSVVRLLTHKNAPACRDFALQCMEYASKTSEEDLKRIFPKNDSDGFDFGQFWTFAPYVFEALKVNRLISGKPENNEEDFLRVLLWMKRRVRIGDGGINAEYPGVGDLWMEKRALYLPKDGFHPIHKFIGKVGEHIASYLEKIPVTEEMIRNSEPVRIKRDDKYK